MIIGLTGTFASGKDTIMEYLVKRGFGSVSLSDILRDEATKRGMPIDRVTIGFLAEEMRKKEGKAVLMERALAIARKHSNFVIGSIRNIEEARSLQKEKNSLLVAVDAPVELRYKRELQRNREQYHSIEDFKKKEANESSNNPYYMQMHECMRAADIRIINDSTLENLHKKMDAILS
jgi:dephospho-CoA kinase